jgi:predicted metal-dependent hydrolase
MVSIYVDGVTVSVNKDYRHRISNHPKGSYPDATLALVIPQSMNTQALDDWLESNELWLKRYKSEALKEQ